MKKFAFILLLLFFSFSSWATCKSDSQFQDFVISNRLLESTRPRIKLSEYRKAKNLSESCVNEKMQDLIPLLAVKWKKEAEKNNCLDVPPSKKCPKKMRDEIFGNITQVEAWGLYFKKTSDLPDNARCIGENKIAPETEVLTGDIADILTIAYKIERLKNAYNIEDKNCVEKKSEEVTNHPLYSKFKKIYDKGEEAKLEDFLFLWDESLENKNVEAYFFDCQSEPWGKIGKPQRVNDVNYLSQSCKPDTLYSWGPIEKVENIKKNLPPNEEWRGDPNKREWKGPGTFMALTPIQTYGYGDVVVRFKIKDQTPVSMSPQHVTLSKNKEERVGVRARWDDSYQDYTIETASFVESFSYGTPQIYDELVLDIKRYQSKKRAQMYGTSKLFHMAFSDNMKGKMKNNQPLEEFGLDLIKNANYDFYDFSEEVLIKRLRLLLGMILNGQGGVYFQKGVCANIDQHYQTNKQTYFNPK